MGIAASMGAGVIEANRTGGSVKRIHCGWAAHGGVLAGAMAREGVTGPADRPRGPLRLLQRLHRRRVGRGRVPRRARRALGAAAHGLQAVPEQPLHPPGHRLRARDARARASTSRRIASVELGVSDKPFRTIGEPREQKIHPQTPYHAKFSGPYTVASALLGGGGLGVYLDDFTQEAFTDPAPHRAGREGAGRRRRARDRDLPRGVRRRVRVTLDDGTVLEERRDSSRGSEEYPLSRDEHRTKFRLNASRALDDAQVTKLDEAVVALVEGTGSVADVLALTR